MREWTRHLILRVFGGSGGFGEHTSIKTTDHKSLSIYNKTDAVKLLCLVQLMSILFESHNVSVE